MKMCPLSIASYASCIISILLNITLYQNAMEKNYYIKICTDTQDVVATLSKSILSFGGLYDLELAIVITSTGGMQL